MWKASRQLHELAERITANKTPRILDVEGFLFLLVVVMDGYGISKEGCDLSYPEIPEGWDL